MRVRLLGPIEVETEDGTQVLLPRAAKVRAVLVRLALQPGRPVLVSELVDAVWGECPPRTAAKTLQTYIWTLRGALAPESIETLASGYRLCISPEQLDLTTFERRLAEGADLLAAGEPHRAAGCLGAALALWRGDPLVDLAGHASEGESARLTELHRTAQEHLWEARLASGEHRELVGDLEAAVAAEPLRERRWAQLMLALYRSGRQADALRSYQQLRARLREELGIDPSNEVRELESAILAQDPGLFGHMATHPPDLPGNADLPVPASPLLGRTKELADLADLLARCRLLTLTGPGGSGKTRLALALAAQTTGQFPDGVVFVPLASVTDPTLVLPTIGQAARVSGHLAAGLADRRLLLVIDNFEQVVDAASSLTEILHVAPKIVMVVTSREALNVAVEQEYPVPPLDETAAVELFVQRARRVRPDFEADAAVWEICRRVDFLPLAVEFAAAWIKLFNPAHLLTRLDRRLDLLVGGWRDSPARQSTMRAVIDWSYQLLSPVEALRFRRLAVFAGGFDVEAAAAICDVTLGQLYSLVDKNLIQTAMDGRFSLLQTTREYALEQADQQGELEVLRRAHALWYYQAADQWRRETSYWYSHETNSSGRPISGAERRTRNERLRAESDNFRAALTWAVDYDLSTAVDLLAILSHLWEAWDLLPELDRWFERAFARAGDIDPVLRATGLRAYGSALTVNEKFHRATRVVTESLRICREIGDRQGEGVALDQLANILLASGQSIHATPVYRQALDIFTELGDVPKAALVLLQTGNCLRESGQLAEAREALTQSLALHREIEHDLHIAATLHSLGDLDLDERATDQARSNYMGALRLSMEIHANGIVAQSLAGLACVAAQCGSNHEAGLLWGTKMQAQQTYPSHSDPPERARYERLIDRVRSEADFASGARKAQTIGLNQSLDKLLTE